MLSRQVSVGLVWAARGTEETYGNPVQSAQMSWVSELETKTARIFLQLVPRRQQVAPAFCRAWVVHAWVGRGGCAFVIGLLIGQCGMEVGL